MVTLYLVCCSSSVNTSSCLPHFDADIYTVHRTELCTTGWSAERRHIRTQTLVLVACRAVQWLQTDLWHTALGYAPKKRTGEMALLLL